MTVKARLAGHDFDLDVLREHFCKGDPSVDYDDDGYYLTSTEFGDTVDDVGALHSTAKVLLDRIIGITHMLDAGFRPVTLTGHFEDGNGSRHAVIMVDAIEGRSRLSGSVTITGGTARPKPPPPGPSYVRLAEKHTDVADVFRLLSSGGQEIGWVDLYKIFEIVRANVGGNQHLLEKGWVPKSEIKAFTGSANHPGASGDLARHARNSSDPPQSVMALQEARVMIRTLVSRWISTLS